MFLCLPFRAWFFFRLGLLLRRTWNTTGLQRSCRNIDRAFLGVFCGCISGASLWQYVLIKVAHGNLERGLITLGRLSEAYGSVCTNLSALDRQTCAASSRPNRYWSFLFVYFPLFIYALMDSVNEQVLHHNNSTSNIRDKSFSSTRHLI